MSNKFVIIQETAKSNPLARITSALRSIPVRIIEARTKRQERLRTDKSRVEAASLLQAKEHAQRSLYRAIRKGAPLKSVKDILDKFSDLLIMKDDFNDCLPLLSAHYGRRVILEFLIDRIVETGKQDSFEGLVDELISRRHFNAAVYAHKKGLTIKNLDSVSIYLNRHTKNDCASWQYLVKAKDNLPDVLLDETPA